MFQRATDTAVLTAFSIVYSCAVALLRRRTRRLDTPQYREANEPARPLAAYR